MAIVFYIPWQTCCTFHGILLNLPWQNFKLTKANSFWYFSFWTWQIIFFIACHIYHTYHGKLEFLLNSFVYTWQTIEGSMAYLHLIYYGSCFFLHTMANMFYFPRHFYWTYHGKFFWYFLFFWDGKFIVHSMANLFVHTMAN